MKSHIGLVLILLIISSLFASYAQNYERYVVNANVVASISALFLWIWMIVDLAKREDIENKAIWAILFLVLSFIASIFYYIFIYYPKQKGNLFQEIAKRVNSRLIYFLSIFLMSFIVTCSHYFVMSKVYMFFGIPFENLYIIIISKGIYKPLHSFLVFLFKLMEFDLEQPGKILLQISHMATFAYTMLLYSLILLAGNSLFKIYSFKEKS